MSLCCVFASVAVSVILATQLASTNEGDHTGHEENSDVAHLLQLTGQRKTGLKTIVRRKRDERNLPILPPVNRKSNPKKTEKPPNRPRKRTTRRKTTRRKTTTRKIESRDKSNAKNKGRRFTRVQRIFTWQNDRRLPEYKVTKKIGLNKCFKKRCTRKQHCRGNCKFCNSVTKLCTLYKGRVGKGNSCTDNRDCRSNKCRMPSPGTGKILLGGQTGACEPSPGTSSNADLNDLRQQIQAFAFTKEWRLPNYLQNPEFDIEGVTRPQCPMYYFGPRPQCTSFSACVRRGEGLRSLDGIGLITYDCVYGCCSVRKANKFENPIQEEPDD